MRIVKRSTVLLAGVSALMMVGPVSAHAASKPQMFASNSMVSASGETQNIYSAFTPKPGNRRVRLDYEVLDAALDGTVIWLGPSTRRHMSRPNATLGTRFVSGHVTPYRLEGSRVSFSFFSEEFQEELTAYREDLERIGSEIDLTTMPKNEQLAYWFNLHNVALIEQISKQYPSKYPNRLKVDDVPLDDAKILIIQNVPLSLRDIREKIVFPNWNKAEVVYGFFRGDIGSPALQNYAYTGDNVDETLKIQAEEFVNSLRGFNLTSRNREVSKLYEEVKPYYFANWEQDITRHLLKHAREDVAEDIRKVRPYKIDKYDTVVADLVGGSRPRIARARVESGTSGNTPLPAEVVQLLRELETKTQVLRKRKLIGRRGVVTIEDIDTIPVDIPPPPTVVED